MRSAVKALPLTALLLITAANAWAAADAVRVQAMVGEAVVAFENIDCPDDVFVVATGERALTNPSDCEALVALSELPDKVGTVVWAIAALDLNDPAALQAIEALLSTLNTGEQVMVIAVLENNAHHLGTDDSTVVATVQSIIVLNPDAAGVVVGAAVVLDPGNADRFQNLLPPQAPGGEAGAPDEGQPEREDDARREMLAPPDDDGGVPPGGGDVGMPVDGPIPPPPSSE